MFIVNHYERQSKSIKELIAIMEQANQESDDNMIGVLAVVNGKRIAISACGSFVTRCVVEGKGDVNLNTFDKGKRKLAMELKRVLED